MLFYLQYGFSVTIKRGKKSYIYIYFICGVDFLNISKSDSILLEPHRVFYNRYTKIIDMFKKFEVDTTRL